LGVNRVVDALYSIFNLVRFAHNWNVGILERWNIGFWEIGILVYWKNSSWHGREYVKKWELSFKINIPLFHHSIIPCARQKHRASKNIPNFSQLYKFRDVELAPILIMFKMRWYSVQSDSVLK